MRLTFIIATLIILSGCTSMHKKLLNAQLGQHKTQILSKFSSPNSQYRSKGLDHWSYKTVKKAKNSSEKLLYTHTLSFKEGILVKKDFKRSFTKKEIQEFEGE